MSNNVWLNKISHLLTGKPQSRDDLINILRNAADRELVDPVCLSMLEGVLGVVELQARDIMIPRSQMNIIQNSDNINEILPIVIETAHSRFPVIGDNKDEILGILLAKDLLAFGFNGHTQQFSIKDIIRPAVFIPESKRLDTLLHEFRNNRNHMAIVVDEYGGVTGLITIEDVLEQIVGDIQDEYDIDEDQLIKQYDSNTYSIKALTTIEEFNDYFKTNLQDENADTIGGLITRKMKHLPRRNESVVINDITFNILRADSRQVHLLQAITK